MVAGVSGCSDLQCLVREAEKDTLLDAHALRRRGAESPQGEIDAFVAHAPLARDAGGATLDATAAAAAAAAAAAGAAAGNGHR